MFMYVRVSQCLIIIVCHFFSSPSSLSFQSSPPTSRRTESDTEDGGGGADEGAEEYDGSVRDFFGLMTKRNPDTSHMLDVGLMGRGLVGFMQHLFGCLLKELESLILFGEKVEQL